jgi:WD40 repeat protein
MEEEEGEEGREGELVKASLRSKRHFSPSEIALSCCALIGGEGREGGREGGPASGTLAVLGSYDNHVYLFSIPSARQILKLDAHDDAVSCLDALGPYLATGSWDATVKVWSLLPSNSSSSSNLIEPSPLAEFFDHATQVHCVALSLGREGGREDRVTLLAAGAEDGRVIVWDVGAKGMVGNFQGGREGGREGGGAAAVTAVRWGAGGGEGGREGRLYVATADGWLGCYSVQGQLWGSAQCEGGREGGREGGIRCLDVQRTRDGRDVLVTGSGDGSVRLWLCGGREGGEGGREGGRLELLVEGRGAHEDAVTCVALDWSRGRLATGAADATMKVWEVKSEEEEG